VPLTQKGAVFIDEETKTRGMVRVLAISYIVQEREKLDGFPTYDELVQGLPKAVREPFAKNVVALAAPGDAPPAGKVGYYSDGDKHSAVARVSASGRRLFIEYAPDEVFSTNVLGYMLNEPE
jgi:hypothetical protein